MIKYPQAWESLGIGGPLDGEGWFRTTATNDMHTLVDDPAHAVASSIWLTLRWDPTMAYEMWITHD